MNVEKADYGAIIKFGNMQDFNLKLQQEGKTLNEVINTKDKAGMSLLEKSLVARNFEMAKYLLSNGATVNNVSSEGYNEFHYIASNINSDGAIEIAKLLLEKGTSLATKDNRYGNSAFYTLCQEIFKVRSSEGMRFMEECFEYIHDYDDCNKRGYSIRMLINERGTDRLKQIMEGEK